MNRTFVGAVYSTGFGRGDCVSVALPPDDPSNPSLYVIALILLPCPRFWMLLFLFSTLHPLRERHSPPWCHTCHVACSHVCCSNTDIVVAINHAARRRRAGALEKHRKRCAAQRASRVWEASPALHPRATFLPPKGQSYACFPADRCRHSR